jgi:hypothetical protein
MGVRRAGLFLLLSGLALAAGFFLLYDSSVVTRTGTRVVNHPVSLANVRLFGYNWCDCNDR